MTNPVHPERQGRRFTLPWPGRRRLEALIMLGLAPAVLLAVLILAGVDNRLVDVLAQFTAPALLAAVAATAVLALLRMRAAMILALVGLVVLAAAVWPQWFPAGPAPDPEAPVVRLYSANVFYLNADMAAIQRSIEAADADIVVLIEVGNAPAREMDTLLESYPHRSAPIRMGRTRGPARTLVASRWPLTARTAAPAGLHAVAVTARTPLGPLDIVAVHLTRPWPFQDSFGQISQAMALDRLVDDLEGPVIVAGDFNSVSSARIGKQIRRDIDLHPAPGFPGTWPSGVPSAFGVTIDQVYASGDLAFVSRRLGAAMGSDHRPVVTEITRAAP